MKQCCIRWIAFGMALLGLILSSCGSGGVEEKLENCGEDFSLVLEDLAGRPGDTISLGVYLKNNPGFHGMSFCVSFDDTVFASLEETILIEDDEYSMITYETDGNGIGFGWTSLTSYGEDGELCRLKLRIAEDAVPGEYPVRLIFRPNLDSFYQVDGEEMPDVSVVTYDGIITVK